MDPNPNILSTPSAPAPREGKTEVNILFLGGAKRVSFGRKLIEAGRRMGMKVNIFSYELSLEVPIAAVGKVIVGLKWKDRKLMESLREAVETYKIDIILPFVDPAIEIAGKFVARNSAVWSPVVPIRMAHILFDKGEAATLFADNGIPVPPTYRGGRPKFPLIAKPRHGSASKGIFLVTDVTDFRRVCRMEGYIMEAYIENRMEFTVDAYISAKGRILCVSPRLRIEVLGGEVTRSRTVDYPELTELATRVIRELKLRGPVTLQFIRDETNGSLMLMEINPRLGGGVVCSIHAGADIPRLILEEYKGVNSEPIENVKPGVLICRYFDETVFNA